MKYKRLGDILTSAGLLTSQQLDEALELQNKTHDRLGKVLLDNNYISEGQLIEVLQMQLGIEYVDLTKITISPDMARMIPKEIAKKYQIVPLRLVGDELYLVMGDPLNFVAVEEAKNASRKKIVPLISTQVAIERAITVLYSSEGTAKAIEDMRREMTPQDLLEIEKANKINTLDIDDVQSAPTIRLVNSIIERAVNERASDIHIEPRENELLVRLRIDGLMRNIITVPKELQSSVISRFKVMSGMNIAEKKIPQDGRANIRVKHNDIDLRVSTLPVYNGEKIVIRLLYKSLKFLDKHAIGLEGDNLKKYDALMKNVSGILMIVGPTGSGKSSTMYTMINELNTEQKNLITLEDPIEYNISGINQCQINDKTGMTFANGLRALLRQDPDIIAVGEIRDSETAAIAVRAAITGHLVLSTIHTNDAISTIDRLIDIGVEPYLIADALRGVISQRLVRKICPHCKVAYTPSEDELRMLRIFRTVEEDQEELLFYKGVGCPECFNTGYYGRTAIFEILLLDSVIRHIINEGGRYKEIEAAVMKDTYKLGFSSLLSECRRLILNGTTTTEEAIRTVVNTTDF